jgi:hypothetical protein
LPKTNLLLVILFLQLARANSEAGMIRSEKNSLAGQLAATKEELEQAHTQVRGEAQVNILVCCVYCIVY